MPRKRKSTMPRAWTMLVQKMQQDPRELRMTPQSEQNAQGLRADFYRWRAALDRKITDYAFYDLAFDIKVSIELNEETGMNDLVFRLVQEDENRIIEMLGEVQPIKRREQETKHSPPVIRSVEDVSSAFKPNTSAYDEVADEFGTKPNRT